MGALRKVKQRLSATTRPDVPFESSAGYWVDRYRQGGNSGAGSCGRLAIFKAATINDLIAERGWTSVLELGCGDGSQVALSDYPSYLGVDVSTAAIELCRKKFAESPTRRFMVAGEGSLPLCEVGLSLDVIYHLVEDSAFESYMADLLGHSKRAVVLYTSDADVFAPDRIEPPHILHRPVQRWMADNRPEWVLTNRIANPYPWRAEDQDRTSFADLYIYEPSQHAGA